MGHAGAPASGRESGIVGVVASGCISEHLVQPAIGAQSSSSSSARKRFIANYLVLIPATSHERSHSISLEPLARFSRWESRESLRFSENIIFSGGSSGIFKEWWLWSIIGRHASQKRAAGVDGCSPFDI